MIHKKSDLMDLRYNLLRHSSICPICNKRMNVGYIRGTYIRWASGANIRPLFDPWLAPTPHVIPAYICENCNLIIGKRITRTKKEINNISGKTQNEANCIIQSKRRKMKYDFCPYCDFKLEKGVVYSSIIPTEPPPHLVWSKMSHGRLKKKTTKYLSSIFGLKNPQLSARLCKNCGLFFLRYNPINIKKGNRIGFTILIVLIISYILLFLFLILL